MIRRHRDVARDLAIAFACFGLWAATAPAMLAALAISRLFRQPR